MGFMAFLLGFLVRFMGHATGQVTKSRTLPGDLVTWWVAFGWVSWFQVDLYSMVFVLDENLAPKVRSQRSDSGVMRGCRDDFLEMI